MLEIQIGATESYDESTSEFVTQGGLIVTLEHSLLSLSKWEQKYEKPFLGKEAKPPEEVFAYIRCMIQEPKIAPEVIQQLSQKNLEEIDAYINAKMTATYFAEEPGAPQTRDVITAELIYYWLTVFNIPFTCETWHLNRLFTLIRVCNIKQAKPKKMSRQELAARNRELNAQRRAQLGTKG